MMLTSRSTDDDETNDLVDQINQSSGKVGENTFNVGHRNKTLPKQPSGIKL